MRYRRIGAAALLLSTISGTALAQSGDVVVMRRVIEKPDISQAPTHLAGHWETGSWGSADPSTCSADVQETRNVTCVNANGTVDASHCSEERPESTRHVERTDGCHFAWTYGAWIYPSGAPTCADAVEQTRTVQCRSGSDVFSDAKCADQPKQSTTQTVDRSEGCSYQWVQGEYGPYSSTCSANAQRTRTVQCQRSGDGVATGPTTLAACASSGPRPAATETAMNTVGCTFAWTTGQWTNVSGTGTCSTATPQTRSVTCTANGETFGDSNCTAATRPATTGSNPDYSVCSYTYAYSAWSAPSSTCSAAPTQTRTYGCVRSDEKSTVVSNSFCASGNSLDALSRTVQPIYTGCAVTLANGSFNDSSAWTFAGNAYVSGGRAYMSYQGNVSQTISGFVPGATYTLAFVFENTYNTCNYSYVGYSIWNTSGTWQRIGCNGNAASITFTVPASGDSTTLRLTNQRSDNGLAIDNVIITKN